MEVVADEPDCGDEQRVVHAACDEVDHTDADTLPGAGFNECAHTPVPGLEPGLEA